MVNKIKAYFETLESLSTEALTDSAEKLVRAEKRNVALLIAHIAEMSRRKAELECGYKNIFEYCVKKLHLSEGSVALRLQVANVSRLFPQLLVALAENRISLTVAGHLAPHLREDNVDKLLSDCAGMTKRAVEEYLVALRPKPVFNPSIRKRPSSKQKSDTARTEGRQETTQETEHPNRPDTAPPVEETPRQPPPSSSPNVLEPALHDTFNFRFSADGNFKAKFARLAEVLGVENPLKHMAEIFERAVDISLEKKDPKKKLERASIGSASATRRRENLVQTRFRQPREFRLAEGTWQNRATFLPKYASAFTRGLAINASIRPATERGAAPERDSRSTMSGPLQSIVATKSDGFGCCAAGTMVSRRSVCTGLSSSGPRLKKKSVRRFPEAA